MLNFHLIDYENVGDKQKDGGLNYFCDHKHFYYT